MQMKIISDVKTLSNEHVHFKNIVLMYEYFTKEKLEEEIM